MDFLSYVALSSLLSFSLVSTVPAHPLSLNPGSALISTQNASSNHAALFAPLNVTQTNASIGASPVDCDGNRYGSDVRWDSCLNALAKLSEDSAPLTFGMRETVFDSDRDVILPYRIISDDGKDYIDIATRDNAETQDVSSWREIWLAASEIIHRCVSQPVPKGGIVTDLGVANLLTVTVSSYDNSRISCINAISPQRVARYESCKSILADIPWDTTEVFWGPPSPIGAHITVLPISYYSRDGQCELSIAMRGLGYDSASWADIWAAAVAADEMCVKQRKIGAGIGLGK